MAPMPFYLLTTCGILGLFMAFWSGSEVHFAVSVACSVALALQMLFPIGRRPVVRGGDRLDIRVTEELPPLGDAPTTSRVATPGARRRSFLTVTCLLAGYAFLAGAFVRPTPTWVVASALCSAATLLVLPAAAQRTHRGGAWRFELSLGSLRLSMGLGDEGIDEADAAALRVDESVNLRWDEAVARIAPSPMPLVIASPAVAAPETEEVLVGDDVAASLRARWGIATRPAARLSQVSLTD